MQGCAKRGAADLSRPCATLSQRAMEEAGVPESTTQLIVGHKRQSLTYGHYSKGERLRKDLREYIGRLRYSKDVMKLIRGP
jgi:hypothetical protein